MDCDCAEWEGCIEGAAKLEPAKFMSAEGAADGGRLWPCSLPVGWPALPCGLADEVLSKRLREKARGELACEALLRCK